MSEPEGPPWPMHEVRHRWTFVEMLLSSIASLAAALVLSVEAWLLAQDPDAIFSCDVNSKISCGTVGLSWQASVFGFPNAFLGLIFEPIVITLAVAALALAAGASTRGAGAPGSSARRTCTWRWLWRTRWASVWAPLFPY